MPDIKLVKHHIILLATLLMTACASPGGNKSALLSLGDMENGGCLDRSYSEDTVNEAKSIILPVSLDRARALITDGAIPFGFSIPKNFETEIDFIANSNILVKMDNHYEPMIYVKLEPVRTGDQSATKIIVDTLSTHLVMKGRHHPYAGSIIQHTACLYNLIDVELKAVESPPVEADKAGLPEGISVDLILARAVTSHTAILGDKVPFIVTHDVVKEGKVIIPKATRAWGKVTTLKAASGFMKGGKLALELSNIELPGQGIVPLRFKNMEQNEEDPSTSNKLVDTGVMGITGGLMMIATVGLILPFVDGAQAVMRAGTEITVETDTSAK